MRRGLFTIVVHPRYPTFKPVAEGFKLRMDTEVYDKIEQRRWVMEKGFVTDFYSLPAPLRIFYRTWGKGTMAAVLHDWLIKNKQWDRAYADDVLRRAMVEYGERPAKAKLFHLGVSLATWFKGSEYG